MSTEVQKETGLEIGHVLFIDIVGYSKRTVDEQKDLVTRLNELVRNTAQFRSADAAGKLIRIPTGDGMALAFFTSPDAPVNCAIDLAKADQADSKLGLRMGIHSGPVDRLADVNERTNLAGAGMNMAQRVMDCGDAGHILMSQRIADDLAQYDRWRPLLHNHGEVDLKHGVRLGIVSLYDGGFGNAAIPARIKQAQEERAAFRHRAEKARRRRIIVGAAAVMLLLVGISLGTWVWQRHVALTSAEKLNNAVDVEKSIAVLPFENLSEEKENAYFAGGVQDEILSDLAKIADLKVISRTSVMKYKNGPERNLREIAKTLGVSHVVEGSVQRAGGRVRVNAQLIDARNDNHLWAEHYDRDFADIFAIQSEIAQRIADQLRAKLSDAEKAAITERPTADLVAYTYYTKAKELDTWTNWEGDEKNLNQKVELLEKAIQRDPNFALAYCALAKTQTDLGSIVGEPDNRKHLELAKQAAEAALRVSPELGEAHLELARCHFFAGAYSRAREELAIVGRKLPNNAEALMIDGRIGRHENRWEASLANLQKANRLDPQNGDILGSLGLIYFEMRRYSEREHLQMKAAANGALDAPALQGGLAQLKLAQGDPVAAQSLLEQIPLDYSPGAEIWDIRFMAALYLRDYDAANQVIAATPAKWADFSDRTSSWLEGQVARARGDQRKALAAFTAAREKLEAQLPSEAKDAMYLSEVAILDAGQGKKEEAISEATRAAKLLPIAKDSLNGVNVITNLALVYAWTGERDRALEQLATVAKIPNGPTYGDLRFNPCWDDLRGDPRFEKIVASLAPKDAAPPAK